MSTNWKDYNAECAVRWAHAPDRSEGYAKMVGHISAIMCSEHLTNKEKVDRTKHLIGCYFQAQVLPEAEARATLVMKGGR